MAERGSPWSRFRDLSNESPWKAVIVTVAVCLVGSILVSATAVLLKPRQLANQERERLARIVEIVGEVPGAADRLVARVVDLATGDYAPRIDPRGFDAGEAAADPALGVAIPPARDIAGIGRRARHAVV